MDLNGYTIAAIFFLVVLGAAGLGYFVASSLRMRDYGTKLAVIFASILGAVAIVATMWDQIKLGIDLAGGVRLIYEVVSLAEAREAEPPEAFDPTGAAPDRRDSAAVDLETLVSVLGNRINPTGLEEIVIRPYGVRQIEIIVPRIGQDEVEQLKSRITRAGVLEFRIVVDPQDQKYRTHVEAATDPDQRENSVIVVPGTQRELARWVEVGKEKTVRNGRVLYDDYVGVMGLLVRDAASKRLVVAGDRRAEASDPIRIPNDVMDAVNDPNQTRQLDEYLAGLTPPVEKLEVLVATDDGYNVTGEDLARVAASVDQRGFPAVSFVMRDQAEAKFGQLTGENAPDASTGLRRRLGILLDETLVSAPNLNERITKRGEITGGFTNEDVQELVGVLRAGSLPATLKKTPLREDIISATLGEVTINQGKWALIIGGLSVLVFMLFYYRLFAGVIANLAVMANLALILAVMILIKAKLTLPGLAGLVLMVGMAVDANVLIFERIREELQRGAALRMAIRNGFDRATSTIVDANLTTLITAVVLYAIGTEEIRGFAVTLILGILTSMFTAIYCARAAFEIAERKRWLTRLSMAQFFRGTRFDFVSKQRVFAAASLAAILLGLVFVGMRGATIFDIDLAGGSSVEPIFKPEVAQTQATEPWIRQRLLDENRLLEEYNELLDAEVAAGRIVKDEAPRWRREQVYVTITRLPGVVEDGVTLPEGSVWKIDSNLPQVTLVRQAMGRIFTENGESMLMMQDMSFTPPRAVSASAPRQPAEDATGRRGDLPADNVLALADERLLLAQAEGAEEGQEQQAPEAPLQPAPDVVEEPVQTPPLAPAPEEAPQAEAPATSAARMVESRLTFDHSLDRDGVRDHLREAIGALGLSATPQFTLTPVSAAGEPLASRPEPPSRHWRVALSANADVAERIFAEMRRDYTSMPKFYSFGGIEGQIAGDAQRQALLAIFVSLLGIIIYIWLRFQRVMYGLAAVVAVVHDVLITLGAIAVSAYVANALGFLLIEEFRINLPMIAAFLTVIGYSLNDTIVVFDRIREVRGKSPKLTAEMINQGINQTLSRTVLTSGTTLLVIVILYAIGGPGIHGFAFALLVGVGIGTYSSIFVAAPMLLWMAGRASKKKELAKPAPVKV